MTVVGKPKQISAGRKGNWKDAVDRSYTVAWKAIVDDPHDGPMQIGNHSAFPLRFQPYIGYEAGNDDPDAVCVALDVDPYGGESEWRVWLVTATFSTQSGNPTEKNNPDEEPPIAWIETEFIVEEYTKEWDGTEIKNSAGQLIAGLSRKKAVETWVWEKNYLAINRGVWKAFQNTINSVPFYEANTYEGLLHIVVPKPNYRKGVPFWRVQFRVEINKDKWTVNPPNKGTVLKTSGGGFEVPIDPRTSQKIDGEVYLDQAGQLLSIDTDDIIRIGEKFPYEPKNFYQLGFDQ